jgi:hypothetical protein
VEQSLWRELNVFYITKSTVLSAIVPMDVLPISSLCSLSRLLYIPEYHAFIDKNARSLTGLVKSSEIWDKVSYTGT